MTGRENSEWVCDKCICASAAARPVYPPLYGLIIEVRHKRQNMWICGGVRDKALPSSGSSSASSRQSDHTERLAMAPVPRTDDETRHTLTMGRLNNGTVAVSPVQSAEAASLAGKPQSRRSLWQLGDTPTRRHFLAAPFRIKHKKRGSGPGNNGGRKNTAIPLHWF